MKILHTSDWHLGRMLYGRSLLEDQSYFIDHIFLPAVRQHRPDLILIAGDIYDRQIAPVEAIRLFDRVLSELHLLLIPVAIISGNHDGAARLAVGASMLRQSDVYIASRIEDVMEPAFISGENFSAQVFLLPYCEPAEIRQFLGREDLKGFNDAYCALLEQIRENFQPDALHLLVSHCFVAGSQLSDSESTLYVGGSGEINPEHFSGFDYVALGHLHAPQKAGENGRYSGSPLKYSFDEENQKKSMSLITLENKKMELELLPISPLHDICTLKGTVAELLAAGQVHPNLDYLALHITDPSPVYMPAEQLRPYYPNLLSIHCDWLDFSADQQSAEIRKQLHCHHIEESIVFEEFLTQICGITITESDKDLFEQLLTEVKQKE